jgi:hypothetical protein
VTDAKKPIDLDAGPRLLESWRAAGVGLVTTADVVEGGVVETSAGAAT